MLPKKCCGDTRLDKIRREVIRKEPEISVYALYNIFVEILYWIPICLDGQ